MQEHIPQKAVILWLSGIELAHIRDVPEAKTLAGRGVCVELLPTPITGPLAQAYQAFSGHSPAHSGFFDTLVPHDYTVSEQTSGRGINPKLLPDLLRTVGWRVDYLETHQSELAASVERVLQSQPTGPACVIVKCEIAEGFETTVLGQVLRAATAWVGETGLLALLSDIHPAPVTHYVNINNFLAEMGILERDEQDGNASWPDSLAYYAGHGQLWINLIGRDPQGAVHPQDEYEEVRDSLVKALPHKLLDQGVPVIERIYRKEELYGSSDYLFCMPDLVVVFAPGYAPSAKSARVEFDVTTFTTPARGTTASAGVHPSSVTGFLLASAPNLLAGIALPVSAPLTALVPTVLHALGVEYVDMETAAIAELYNPSYLEAHPIHLYRQNQELSEEDEERIIGHLRDLGYV